MTRWTGSGALASRIRAAGVPVLIAGAVLGGAACGDRQGTTASGHGLDGPDRIVVAETEDVYAVGMLDGEEWQTFGEVSDVAFDAAANLYVLDRVSHRVVVVDQDGALVRTVGQAGEGPGEFREPTSLAVFGDGSLAVFDIDRISSFDPEGEFRAGVAVDPASLGGVLPSSLAIQPLSDGRVLAVAQMSVRSLPPEVGWFEGDLPEFDEGLPLNVIAFDGGEPEALFRAWEPPPPEPGEMEVLESEGGQMAAIFVGGQRAFDPRLLVAPTPLGVVVVVDSVSYRVKMVAMDGSVAGTIERPIPPVPVTESVKERERERRLQELDEDDPGVGSGSVVRSSAVRDGLERSIALLQFMDEIPVIRAMAVDRSGTIWIARSGADGFGDGPIDLVAQDGGYVGSLEPGGPAIPDAFGPDGLMAYIEEDELGVGSVRVMRLTVLRR